VECGRNCFKRLQGQQLCLGSCLHEFNSGWSNLASSSEDLSSLVGCPNGTCLKTFQGRTNGVHVSFSRMAPFSQWRCDALVRLWDWQQETCSCRNTQIGSGQWHFTRMVKWLRVAVKIKPCGGMCRAAPAAKHCRDTRVGFARQFQPQWTNVSEWQP